jgi:hypothetical protein
MPTVAFCPIPCCGECAAVTGAAILISNSVETLLSHVHCPLNLPREVDENKCGLFRVELEFCHVFSLLKIEDGLDFSGFII